jgi:DNA invertase Pin-like site-specific DNA recombinase
VNHIENSSSKAEPWAIWCRVSTIKQKKRDISLPDQEKQAENYIYSNGNELNPQHKFIDQISGKRVLESSEWSRMERCIKRREVVGVVTEDASRIGRTALEAMNNINRWIKEYSIKLVLLKGGGEVNLNDPTSKLLITVLAAFSEFQWDGIVRECHEGRMQAVKEKGHRNIGTLLYGLTWEGTDKIAPVWHQKQTHPDWPPEYPNVRLVVKLRIATGWSMEKIADFLNGEVADSRAHRIAEDLQVTIPTYYRLRAGKRQRWDCDKVRRIFKNEKYYLGENTIKIGGEEYHYNFKPLISKVEHHFLRKELAKFKRCPTRPDKPYLLTGKLVCGICGRNLHHNPCDYAHRHEPNATEYYICEGKKGSYAKKGHRCPLPRVPANWIEENVWKYFEYLFKDKEHFEKIIFSANQTECAYTAELNEIADKKVDIEKTLQRLEQERYRLIYQIGKGRISDDDIKPRMTELNKEKCEVLEQLKELENR